MESAVAEHLKDFAGLTDGVTGMAADIGGFTDIAATEGLREAIGSITSETDVHAQHSNRFGGGVDTCVAGGQDTLNSVCNMLRSV